MSERPTVLVIDDDAGVVEWLVDALDEEGFAVTGETSALRAIDLLSHRAFDLVVSDVEMPELRGLELLRSILRTRPRQLVVLITAFGSIDLAVESLRAGAGDFVAKPFRIEALSLALRRSLRERELRREISRLREVALGETPSGMAAVSRPMKAVVELARKAARSHLPVLVTGESGVGKGVLARFIHQESARASQRFVQLNCAALPAGLAEAELFGVRRGAFTDAKEDRRGVFGQAHLGTLFLDEVGELPLELQPKLLQALESGRVRPVGGSEEVPADVRIVAATNRDLASALRARAFREDLYHRLDVLRLDVPPLRERTDDIQGIVDQVLHTIGRRSGVHLTVSPEAMSLLLAHSWPGNVRELVNAIERAAALADHHVLTPDDFALRDEQSGDSFLRSALARELTLAELEREYVRRVLAKTGGHKGRAAKILGLDRRTLYRKAAELSLEELNSDDD